MNTHADWFYTDCPTIEQHWVDQGRSHQDTLTKPPGSLGRLEQIAIEFCGWQSTLSPECERVQISVFAADHGIAQQGVSAFPPAVTAQMVQNFLAGGAAISVLSRHLNAEFHVVNCGVATALADAPTLVNKPIAQGTQDFSFEPAMTELQCHAALALGAQQICNSQLFIGGEMGIGNTSAASAILSLLLNQPSGVTVGPGTGLQHEGITHKQDLIGRAIEHHKPNIRGALDVLRCVGGFEIAALVGAYIQSAQRGIPVLVDGFITTAAALVAVRLNPSTRPWLMFSHQSAEPAHQLALSAMDAVPILSLEMRLGEGSGAAMAVPVIQNALRLHNGMATFQQAGVSQ
ncbi:nicotinate-nucleotide--dimethylbenzimidazole phosphoribosyltransferase [Arenicella chitinivorans]|uniref:Nicotinate-nucleotide--dimethylbenzimidazole phosphoribosyltransferase n=1 Tax=Arenicella chitinivorans TaxID=1329800 RepID=A0A918VK47_9GAMM|nr:nicotinate-nucleotide--dimethylbenzimidazole phosphoribosyltransferase [Arenicella chitinivorans]GHA02432.1 nicotinate-nucleotide--dimethylbenzimidazole phosphoribosyltransferase [Arenicella chitinivorans]